MLFRSDMLAMLLMLLGALIELAPPYLLRTAIDGPIASKDAGDVMAA